MLKNNILAVLVCVGLLTIITNAWYAGAEIMGDYMGVLTCLDCHEKEALAWKVSKHGHAWDNLKTQGAEKQSIPECFMCHVVAYNLDGGFMDMELTPELADVQCEACHGPGLPHVMSGGKKELIVGKPQENVCRVCHTKGQDKNFDFVKKMEKIEHKRSPELIKLIESAKQKNGSIK